MNALQEVEKILAVMTRSEKAQLLQRVASEFDDQPAGIESTPGVCGGDPCIAGTRIPVRVLEQYRRLGSSEADLLRSFPSCRAEDLVNAWAFVRSHPTEIDRQILDNNAA
jgi:uncharacterized protein (DUF433 family)